MKESKSTLFANFAKSTSTHAGRPVTFGIAILLILVWAISGPLFGFSDTWQLVINTSTTIVTFLMVFLIQNSQNRDSEALQIKLDELIRVQKTADNGLMNLEELPEDELDKIRAEFVSMAKEKQNNDGNGDSPKIEN